MSTVNSDGAQTGGASYNETRIVAPGGITYRTERHTNRIRFIIFAAVALAHALLILFFAITVNASIAAPDELPAVMKLTDIQEEKPAPPPPPEPVDLPQNAVESIAETMLETETVPDQTIVAPGTLTEFHAPSTGDAEVYLPAYKVTKVPVFSEREIFSRMVYPPIAQRSGIEGQVILELVIDRQGVVRQVIILKEDPKDRGFGEAAVKAFEGLRCTPAEANGEAVGVRYRYPVRFSIRG